MECTKSSVLKGCWAWPGIRQTGLRLGSLCFHQKLLGPAQPLGQPAVYPCGREAPEMPPPPYLHSTAWIQVTCDLQQHTLSMAEPRCCGPVEPGWASGMELCCLPQPSQLLRLQWCYPCFAAGVTGLQNGPRGMPAVAQLGGWRLGFDFWPQHSVSRMLWLRS